MCYGSCKYERRNSGTCGFVNRYPADATCVLETFEDDDVYDVDEVEMEEEDELDR